MFQENDELRRREAESIKKLEELSKLLEEATTRNHTEENGDLTDSEKYYDLLPKVVEFTSTMSELEPQPHIEPHA
ncbi:hypothetical protein JHK87_047735 [Glycine soja]|nr:hypothetical protein JHK87_047735 [Glycine soja]